MVFLKNALMCKRKVKLINHDCLPILMLLYIMLAYLMLLAAICNAVCLDNVFFLFAIDFLECFLLSCFVLVYRHNLFISSLIFHHAQCF